MRNRTAIKDWIYGIVAVIFVVGWGGMHILQDGLSWTTTTPLLLYSVLFLAAVLLVTRWLKRKNEELALSDPELNLYSERFFYNALNLECNKSERHEMPVALMVFSFDTLKETADQLGKSVEEIQLLFIETVGRTIRNSDVFSTMKDGRFSILLPSTDADGAKVAANRVKRAISEELKKQRLGQRTTVPFGICGTSSKIKTSKQLLEGSIKAYVEAQRSPRNKIITCADCC